MPGRTTELLVDERSQTPATQAPVAFRATRIPGCLEVIPRVSNDARGRFVKYFHAPTYAARGLDHDFAEGFYTTSGRRVLRGMHFQVPPHDHAKLVWCVAGRVVDVLLDLRRGSPMYGQHQIFDLDETRAKGLYIPRGVAHGFYTLTEPSVLTYLVTSVHSPGHDSGLRWDTIGVKWPDKAPIVSARDAALPSLDAFESPFEFSPNA